ncbi:MAG TPA: hypothetical protein VLC91_05955 [Spongiibacteraceae bacterium]|nr:hypothetical protein [Spongiibacteraceae bacterium]
MAAIKFDIAKIFARLPQFLTQAEFVSIELGAGRGNIHIDGRSCASAISLWANGHCEVALLALSSGETIPQQQRTEQQRAQQKKAEQKGAEQHTEHYEFESEIAAVETITQALKAALEYA